VRQPDNISYRKLREATRPASDKLLYANTKSFSTYLEANNSSGLAYGAARFEYSEFGSFWIYPEIEIFF